MEFFEYKGKKYSVNAKEIPAVNIPGIGVRTAGEILLDEVAQEYLVERGCVGSVIFEIEGSGAEFPEDPNLKGSSDQGLDESTDEKSEEATDEKSEESADEKSEEPADEKSADAEVPKEKRSKK